MAKSEEDRGLVALWMRDERLKRGWKNVDVVKALAARGHHISETSYRGYEAGPKVSAPVRKHLEAIYKSKPPDKKKEAAEPQQLDSLVAALHEQTATMNRLLDYLLMTAGEGVREGFRRFEEESRGRASDATPDASQQPQPPDTQS